MTEYVSYEQVKRLNKVFGGAVTNEAQLRSTLGRPTHTFAGEELHPTIWDKAAALLHGIASTQSFADGNKRTSWVATKYFLELNGETFKEIPQIAREAFVLAVSKDLFDLEQTARWLEEYSLRAKDRVAYALLCDDIMVPSPGAPVTVMGIGAEGGTVDQAPASVQVALVARIQWHRVDAGMNRTASVRIRDEFREWVELDPLNTNYRYTSTSMLVPPPIENYLYPTGMMHAFLNFAVPMVVHGPKDIEIDLMIEDEVAHTFRYMVRVLGEIPDWDAFPRTADL